MLEIIGSVFEYVGDVLLSARKPIVQPELPGSRRPSCGASELESPLDSVWVWVRQAAEAHMVDHGSRYSKILLKDRTVFYTQNIAKNTF